MKENTDGSLWFADQEDLLRYVRNNYPAEGQSLSSSGQSPASQQSQSRKESELQNDIIGTISNRPWGNFLEIASNEPCTVKLMTLDRNRALSTHVHKNRDQIYIAINPIAVEYIPINVHEKGITDYEKFCTAHRFTRVTLNPGNSVLIKRGWIHTCSVHKATNLKQTMFMDIAFGHNDEKDIVRIIDPYGRE